MEGILCQISLSQKLSKEKELVSMSVEQQLSTLRRWLAVLTVVTIIL
jgi:hypothetical protein